MFPRPDTGRPQKHGDSEGLWGGSQKNLQSRVKQKEHDDEDNVLTEQHSQER